VNDLAIEINVAEVATLLKDDPNFLLLDCRNQDEYDLVHLDGCTLIPMGELQERLQEIAAHRSKRVIVYCHLGGRSLQVANWLRHQGYPLAQSMAGGVDAWAEHVDSNLPRY
jgi:rhodanese-related sulfurtransferase